MRISIQNLPPNYPKEALFELFQPFGLVIEYQVFEEANGRTRAAVEMPYEREAQIALQKLNGHMLDTYKIRLYEIRIR